MMDIIDFHTHDLNATRALISVDPQHFNPQPGKWYSVGYHPWHDVDKLTDDDFDLLEGCIRHNQVLAIGETGMDSLQGASLDIQNQVFITHLALAARVNKPVIVHNVRTTQQILTARRQAHLTTVPLAIHGMRGNEHVARTLLDAGCYLSYGHRFNTAALLATPLDRLLIETDDGAATIHDVTATVAAVLHLNPGQVESLAAANASAFLTQS